MIGIRRHYDQVRDELAVSEGDTKHQLLPVAGARHRAGVQDPQADDARAGLRPGDPAVHPRGGHRRRRPGGDQGAAGRVGPARHPGAAEGRSTRRTARSPGRSSTTSSRSAAATRATSSIVYVPEYVVGHWWEQLLHNQSALRLRAPAALHPRRDGRQRPVAAARRPQGSDEEWYDDARLPGPAGNMHPVTGRRRRGVRCTCRRAARAVSRRRRGRPVDVGPVAHGGHCVARHEGRVVFVRHTLPGERVRARVTEGGAGRPLRAGRRRRGARAVAADRVDPPCPYAGPGSCGGLRLAARRLLPVSAP